MTKINPFNGFTEYKIGFLVDAKNLLEKLKGSPYMKKRGYTILYSGDFSSQGYDVFKLCFKEDDKEFLYLHLRFNFGKIDTVHYLIALGDEKVVLADLNAALKE